MPNALAEESSPYLRQHASNPVDWLPWGALALQRAREQDRPLLISIGYSACHWCHVMERESFEDPRCAELMNESFVCVKVDREERPDVDAIYMEAVQAMTGHGGWPLNVFLTPEQVPFYGGTYFPPQAGPQMPSWTQVLNAVSEAWSERSDEIRAGQADIVERLRGAAALTPSTQPLTLQALDSAVATLEASFDTRNAGFGGAPKFPPSSVLELLLARASATTASAPEGRMALQTLAAMAAGGIHDHVGGGFHRYAVDASWTVPHFEKMLYDNALLASAYLHGFQLSGQRRLLEVCLDTLQWALREMRGPEGGFFSALDADSEGVEGRYYVWTLEQLERSLGNDAPAAIAWLRATAAGNFVDPHHPEPGLSVLRESWPEDEQARPDAATRERIRARLLATRQARVRPGLDDKRLTSWNALMISALAETGAYLQAVSVDGVESGLGTELLAAATACAEFIERELRDRNGRLLRTYGASGSREGKLGAYLEDHAFLLEALLRLYQATFQERWFSRARELAAEIVELFGDPERGGFFSTAADHETLIARRKDIDDAPIPSGSSSAAAGMLHLAALTGESSYREQALGVLRLLGEIAPRHPSAFAHALGALHFHLSPAHELAIVGAAGADRDALLAVARERYRPLVVLAAGPGADQSDARRSEIPLLNGRWTLGGRATAYLCQQFSCRLPVTDPSELRALLTDARTA